MTVEEIKAALEGLWESEIQDIAEIENEAERRAVEVAQQAANLRGGILAGERELESLRGELAELPNRLTRANLRGDDAEENRIRSRFNEIEGGLPMIGERIEDHRAALEELEDPDTIRQEAAKEAEHRRLTLSTKAYKECLELGEALQRRGDILGLNLALQHYQPIGGPGL